MQTRDRMLIAQALREGLTAPSSDSSFKAYDIDFID